MTTGRPRDRKPVVKGTAFVLRTIPREALFGTKPVWRGPVEVNVSDPSRTILDMLDVPSLGGGLRPVVEVLRAYLNSSARDLGLLVLYAERLGNGAVYKRLGYLLERFFPAEKSTIEICRSRLSAGNAKLDPSLRAGGLVTKWRLWIPENWKKELESERPA